MINDFHHQLPLSANVRYLATLPGRIEMIDLFTKGIRGFILRNCLGLLAIFLFEVVNNFASGITPPYNTYLIYTGFYVWMVFHNRVLVEQLFQRKKLVLYFLSLLAGLALVTWSQCYYINVFDRLTVIKIACWVINYTLFGATFYYAYRYIIEKREWYQINLLKREVELNQLKSQLNPHFLFNSLNNIYSYNLENNTHGNDLILKLAQLMRYLVEVNNKDKVKLSEEVQFISNYIALEKERLGYRTNIKLNVIDIDPTIEITPLLFFPLIENAFKHGASTNAESWIEINISGSKNLEVTIANSLSGQIKNDSTHVGISNVKRRLDLIYPDKHQLILDARNGNFYTTLKIQLQ